MSESLEIKTIENNYEHLSSIVAVNVVRGLTINIEYMPNKHILTAFGLKSIDELGIRQPEEYLNLFQGIFERLVRELKPKDISVNFKIPNGEFIYKNNNKKNKV